MGLPSIPSSILQYITEAANGTGLPQNVVAAQNYVESSYGTNLGPSSTGAEGPWQFEPSTWSSNSSLPFSDANNWGDSTTAYVKLMNSLIKQENGNVRNALAAYNAGPGNIAAGYGYADEILSLAGQPQNLEAGVPNPSAADQSQTTSQAASLGGIFSFPEQIIGFFKDADTFVNKLLWLAEPSTWLRIGAFFVGGVLLIAALVIFTKADQHISATPVPIPIPV